ncbi:MAG: hypothetical protein JSU94_19795 [Phycisphaerales bacterium]|nr:MAG: hypothetical protein JSU94_19795 [Phycisphaerales bacterium]
MGRHKAKRFKASSVARVRKNKPVRVASQIEPEAAVRRERYFKCFLIAVFLGFGIYQSVIYFGHKVVPISDFPDIVKVGHDLLSFKLPARFKQAPVVGLLQASLSYVVGGQHPDLTAGWLLNGILHPLNLLLFWLVAREIVGRAAVWFAVVAILNYWVLYMLTEPIMETTLLFFVLLTLYLIFRRSPWCYVAGSLAAMVRYEGAALILAAFVVDLIHSKNRQQRLKALLRSVLASIPLAVWMLGTLLTLRSDSTHYLRVLFTKEYAKGFAEPVAGRRGILLHMRLIWTVGFQHLFMPVAAARQMVTDTRLQPLSMAETESIRFIFGVCRAVALAGFAFGAVWGLAKRQWKILVLLIFFVPYFLLHAMYPYPLQRFHATIFWIALLICLFGLQSLWRLIDGNGRVPRAIVVVLHVIVVVTAAVWFGSLARYIVKVAGFSPNSAALPWVAVAVLSLIFIARLLVSRAADLTLHAALLAVTCLMIVSNQFAVAPLLGDGQREAEFKLLADWYVANAKPGQKMGLYMAHVVRMFAPKYAEYIVFLPKAENPDEFDKACYEQGMTYVVWATREGLRDQHTGYRQLNLNENLKRLGTPRDVGPYKFVQQVGSRRGYVNIFRLRSPGSAPAQKADGG